MRVLFPILSILLLFAIAAALSVHRRKINFRTIGVAFIFQVVMAVFVLYIPWGQAALSKATDVVSAMLGYSSAGMEFIFGDLGQYKMGFIFAIHVPGIIIFVSALMSTLYYLGIMQRIVLGLGFVMEKLFGTSKAESTAAAANIFIGNTDVFVMMKPYVQKMTRSELFALMVGGFASIAGTVLMLYVSIGIDARYLILACFMSAPGGLMMAKIIYPETKEPAAITLDIYGEEKRPINIIEAITDGGFTGLKIAVAVCVVLLAMISMIALFNGILSGLGGLIGVEGLTLQKIFGFIFAGFAFMLGVPSDQILEVGNLLGQKIVISEILAFTEFNQIKTQFDEYSQAVIIIALAGFVNISAPAALIGVLGGMVPKEKQFIAQMGMRVIAAAMLANFMSAAIVGVLLTAFG